MERVAGAGPTRGTMLVPGWPPVGVSRTVTASTCKGYSTHIDSDDDPLVVAIVLADRGAANTATREDKHGL